MTTQVTFYHAGCPVCTDAEQTVAQALDDRRYTLESIHLGEHKERLPEAEAQGVRSVPALVIDGQAFHINHGADLADLR